jgi:DNA-binding transcriptional ArsR family regulator
MTDRSARALDRVYGAIADPTRRAMLAALTRGDLTVGALAEQFPLSLNGVSKHVKVLERAGLVTRRVDGREHWIRLEPRPLRAASDWLERYRLFWDARLDALEAMLVGDRPSSARPRSSRRGTHHSGRSRDV